MDTGKIKAVLSMLHRRGVNWKLLLAIYYAHQTQTASCLLCGVSLVCRHAVMIVNYSDVIPLAGRGKRSIGIKIAPGIGQRRRNINICTHAHVVANRASLAAVRSLHTNY